MAVTKKTPHRTSNWYQRVVNPARWEAPDRNYRGHRDILTRNLARYHFVKPLFSGLALEVGCGRGYGLEVIRPKVDAVIGVDVAMDFLQEIAPPARIVQASGLTLPFKDRQFDTVVAFEVIEHIQADQAFIEDLRRVARSTACVAISTPNRLASSGKSTRPLDPYHVREYVAGEFASLLRRSFPRVVLYGQHDHAPATAAANRLLDRVPIRWKYILPAVLQGWLSARLRQPLRLEDCVFETDRLEHAHTLLAICHL